MGNILRFIRNQLQQQLLLEQQQLQQKQLQQQHQLLRQKLKQLLQIHQKQQQLQLQITHTCGKVCPVDLNKFTVYIFQCLNSPAQHTGAILEYSDIATDFIIKFDFGYGHKCAHGSKSDNQLNYNHLGITTITKNYLFDPNINIIYNLTYLYQSSIDSSYPLKVMLDKSKYNLFRNNCRHYIINLINRLSYGRNKHKWELDVIEDISNKVFGFGHIDCKYYNEYCVNS